METEALAKVKEIAWGHILQSEPKSSWQSEDGLQIRS